MRPAIRLAALMGLHVVYVFTHDSVFLGEDGPTHQPIEQLASLRAIPNLTLLRPADACETVEAWRFAIAQRKGPVVLALTRQSLPILEETAQKARQGVARGAYVLCDPVEGSPQAILIATGSEVSLAREAHRQLAARGVRTRVVSMPSTQLFDRQPQEYRDAVLPPAVTRRLAIEAASPFGWHKYVGAQGAIHGLERFGASAPYKALAEKLGFTVEAVVGRVEGMVGP
jgi:transketolase